MAPPASTKYRLLLSSQKQGASDSSIGVCQDKLPDTLSRSHQSLECATQLFARTLSRRGFLKISLGTIIGVQFPTMGWPHDRDTAPETEPVFPGPPYFSQDNFPDRFEYRPGQFISRDQTRLLLAFKVRQTPVSLKPFLKATQLVLEELSPKSSIGNRLINKSHRHFWVRKDQPQNQHSPIGQDTLALLAQALGKTLDWVGPVYSHTGAAGLSGHFCASPHVLLLKLRGDIRDTLPPSVAQILKEAHLREVPNKSKFLTHHRYFELDVPHNGTVFSFYRLVREGQVPFVQDAQVNSIPLIKSGSAVSPNDPSYGLGNTGQWNLRHIHADTGWDLSTGSPDVAIWVIDDGFDSVDRSTVDQRTDPHPDIRFNHRGIDLSTMLEIDPAIWLSDASGEGHGSACAGIAAATTNNTTGIASVAGGLYPTPGCRIYPLCLIAPTDSTQYANAFNFAATVQSDPMQQTGIPTPLRGSVISISHGVPWDTSTRTALGLDASVIDIEINKAHGAGIVICASSGNDDRGDNAVATPDFAGVTYPATNPFVIACGASNQSDTRVTAETAPDGTQWGSNFGTHLSVVAPGVAIPSTDLQDLLQPIGPAQPLGYSTGDYVVNFWGTSAAAPQVAGLAALLRSRYDLLATQVREIIEQTAQKTGSVPYEELSSKPNGRWNNQMGYGLIDVFRALDFADVMIKDHPFDNGTEPFDHTHPSTSLDQSDIVIRPTDDVSTDQDFNFWRANVHTHLVKGQDNFLYVRLKNRGPNAARNVNVTTWLVAPELLGTMLDPGTDPMGLRHRIPRLISKLPLHSLAANESRIVKYVVSASVISWMNANWTPPPIVQPFVQAVVSADNDYAFETASKNGGNIILRRNNLAAVRLSIVSSDSIAPSAPQNLRAQ